MDDGEILAVNGPPGTGKTTLLQSIVADMYVKRAMNKEKAPLIVASSTNNQAVTNIIASFGNIKKMGISNLEERWIEGVDSFATYFPSASKIKESKNKGYQYTNQKGEFFISDIEDKENIEKSKTKLIQNCNEYFGIEYKDISACENKLHDELIFLEKSKNTLLSLVQEVAVYDLKGETIDKHLNFLGKQIEEKQVAISNIRQRINDWEACYKQIPFLYKLLESSLLDLKQSGYQNIYLWVLKENQRARHFYEKNKLQCNKDECICEIMEKNLLICGIFILLTTPPNEHNLCKLSHILYFK